MYIYMYMYIHVCVRMYTHTSFFLTINMYFVFEVGSMSPERQCAMTDSIE